MNPTASLSPRVTIAQVADRAKVSAMTVSRALGNRPRVSEATRRRVVEIATKLGYRPDPEITKLMHHLRGGRRRRFQSVIYGLTTWPVGAKPPYFEALIAGAALHAQQRGYTFVVQRIDRDPAGWKGVQRVLENRGVEGVLLLPQGEPMDLEPLLDWEKFSVVTASPTVLAPVCHQVTPHHFANTLLLCRKLAARGYRRVGLVIDADHDRRVNHGFTAAVTWYGQHEAGATFVPPLVFEGEPKPVLLPWFKREAPDALIVKSDHLATHFARLLRLKIPGPVAIGSTSVDAKGTTGIPGIDELPGEIGASAVDLLTSLVERRSRGLPPCPASTLIAGRWAEGSAGKTRP